MNRTADEALYDSVVRPLIPYEAPVSWKLLTSDEQEKAVQEKKLCSRCLAPIIPFQESFRMDAGHGCTYEVSQDSGLCRACFDALRANPPTYRPHRRTVINYAFGTAELQTISEEE